MACLHLKHTAMLQGVGGTAMGSTQVRGGELAWLKLSSSTFRHLKCLFTSQAGLDISRYSCGLLCADLMARCTVVIDYARSRLAFVPSRRQDGLNKP